MTDERPVRVVAVIDEYHCTINRGSEDGVGVGDRYLIYGLGEEIKDPDTGESLGVLEIVRGRGKVSHLQPKMATLETYEREGPPSKRIIKRNPFAILGETIEEVGHRELAMFVGVETGDHARPI